MSLEIRSYRISKALRYVAQIRLAKIGFHVFIFVLMFQVDGNQCDSDLEEARIRFGMPVRTQSPRALHAISLVERKTKLKIRDEVNKISGVHPPTDRSTSTSLAK